MRGVELAGELKRRGRRSLYHACTLTSFQSYCELGAYRSRAAVEAAGLPLTPQVSDETDHRLDVWKHLFLNIYDQHGDVHKGKSVTGLNKYGPILMELSAVAVSTMQGESVGYRLELTRDDYDPARDDVRTLADFREQTFRDPEPASMSGDAARRPGTRGPNMCVHVDDAGLGVPFEPLLQRVVVDRFPAKFAGLQQEVLDAVRDATGRCAPRTRVELRDCIATCGCRDAYASMKEEQIRRFVFESNIEVYGMRLPRQSRVQR